MKNFTTLFAVAAASSLPSVHEWDSSYVPPVYAAVAGCVDSVTYNPAVNKYWEANCLEYCWHYAHYPQACGFSELPSDYNDIVDCLLRRHSAHCADMRTSKAPVAAQTTPKKGDSVIDVTEPSATEAGATTASAETRAKWVEHCQDYVYTVTNKTWDAYCKETLCTHYNGSGWTHCWNSQSAKEYAQCVTTRHPECSYWNEIDPTPLDTCLQQIYLKFGPGCMPLCETCDGETADELIACAEKKTETECTSDNFAPEFVPSQKVAEARN